MLKFFFCKHNFSPLNTLLWKGKDPDPYLWLMNPHPWGPKTCGSGSGLGSGFPTLHSGPSSAVQFYRSHSRKKTTFRTVLQSTIFFAPCTGHQEGAAGRGKRRGIRQRGRERHRVRLRGDVPVNDKSMIDESITILLGWVYLINYLMLRAAANNSLSWTSTILSGLTSVLSMND